MFHGEGLNFRDSVLNGFTVTTITYTDFENGM